MERYLRETRRYGHPSPEKVIGLAELLDSTKRPSPIAYREADARSLFMETVDTLLRDKKFLDRANLLSLPTIITTAAKDKFYNDSTETPQDVLGGRTWFAHIADAIRAKAPGEADNLNLFASAVAQFCISQLLGVDAAYAIQLSRIILPMHRMRLIYAQELDEQLREDFLGNLQNRFNIGPRELATLDVDFLADIRKGRSFRTYKAKVLNARTREDRDLMTVAMRDAVAEYIADLRDSLSLEVTGSRADYERLNVSRRWTVGIGAGGGITTSGLGLVLPLPGAVGATISGIGILWSVAAAIAPDWFSKRMKETVQKAHQELLKGPPADRSSSARMIQIGGTVKRDFLQGS